MKPLTIDQLEQNEKDLQKKIKKSKAAQKAMKKATRKMKKALRSTQTTEISILLGMAKVAIDKAEFIARNRK